MSGHYPDKDKPPVTGGLFDGTSKATEEDHGLPEGWRNARLADPDTSRAAAFGDRTTITEKIYVVLEAFTVSGAGATKWDVADASGILAESVHKRISDLQRDGRAEDTGWRRPGPSGRQCIVWQTTNNGEATP